VYKLGKGVGVLATYGIVRVDWGVTRNRNLSCASWRLRIGNLYEIISVRPPRVDFTFDVVGRLTPSNDGKQ
jgi:hypothetical protein